MHILLSFKLLPVAFYLKFNIWMLPKIVVPQIIHFNRVFHYKPSILGTPIFWKHPFVWGGLTPPYINHPSWRVKLAIILLEGTPPSRLSAWRWLGYHQVISPESAWQPSGTNPHSLCHTESRWKKNCIHHTKHPKTVLILMDTIGK